MTWIQILNMLFAAHREKDLVTERYYADLLAEVEPTYAEILDRINY